MMGFGSSMTGQGGAPWAGLPAAPAAWAQSASPWRLSPWQTQGLPGLRSPGAQPAPQAMQLMQAPGFQRGLDLPGFDPLVAGGGMAGPSNLPPAGLFGGSGRAINADYLAGTPGASPYHQGDSSFYAQARNIDPRSPDAANQARDILRGLWG